MKNMIVIVVAAFIIYYIGREVLATFRHVSDQELEDFWAERIRKENPKAHRRISEHLASCKACRDRLDEVRQTSTGPGVEGPMIERKY